MARSFDVAVMHDFFVDRLVYTKSLEGLAQLVTAKAAEGGGGIHDIRQSEMRGGNAVNLANALANLGLRTLLLTHSDRAHEALLREPFKGLDAEVRVKPRPPGLTVAFEGRVNVMLGEGGGAADFGPGLLDEDDWVALKAAGVVCSVNWAANRRGTDLLLALRKRLGKGKTIFFDPADFRDRLPGFTKLLALIKDEHLVDWMSLNEHEALAIASALRMRKGNLNEVCSMVAKKLGLRLDVHTARESLTSAGARVVAVRAKNANARRLTGAGDVWDAASIYGRLKRMPNPDRLNFANTAAGLYLEAETPAPPDLEQVLSAVN